VSFWIFSHSSTIKASFASFDSCFKSGSFSISLSNVYLVFLSRGLSNYVRTLSILYKDRGIFLSIEVIFSMQSDSPAKILKQNIHLHWCWSPWIQSFWMGEFAYPRRESFSLKKQHIASSKRSLGVDTALDSELLKLPATLFISLIFINLSISFPYFCSAAIRDRTEFIFCVFSLTSGKRAITDRSDILPVIPLSKKNPNLDPCFKPR
jgi:hypothetical protein